MGELPKAQKYHELTPRARAELRGQYVLAQKGLCMYCRQSLAGPASLEVRSKAIDMSVFPSGFLSHAVHLQHDHRTGLTEGAVHALCNAFMWVTEGR